MSTFAIVDLSNLFQRARHGVNADADTKVGMAILIVFRSLRKMYRESKIDHFVFAIDHGSWRYKYYPAYKSRRKLARLSASPAEQDENTLFTDALNKLVVYFSQHTRCTVLDAQDVEGDDFIARWIGRHPHDNHMIISGDSDFVQLISPHVGIYDAINQRYILLNGIVDERGQRLSFSVSPKDGKLKVGPVKADFVPEREWWRKALFIKLLRGDTGDSVFSAYPGVRYEGKKCSIRAAWDDRKEQGYDWNNLMFQTWKKLVGSNDAGEPLTETVRVIDEYKINQTLIDLNMQPTDVLATMDRVIDAAIAQPMPTAVGIAFLRLCAVHDQPSLAKEANDHVTYLMAKYPPKDQINVAT
jgi:hypothetical protein